MREIEPRSSCITSNRSNHLIMASEDGQSNFQSERESVSAAWWRTIGFGILTWAGLSSTTPATWGFSSSRANLVAISSSSSSSAFTTAWAFFFDVTVDDVVENESLSMILKLKRFWDLNLRWTKTILIEQQKKPKANLYVSSAHTVGLGEWTPRWLCSQTF